MQECTRWWRGKHSTAWVKQEILIVRPALASSDPTVSSRHQEFSILWPNLVAGAPGRKCLMSARVISSPIWHYTDTPLYAGNYH